MHMTEVWDIHDISLHFERLFIYSLRRKLWLQNHFHIHPKRPNMSVLIFSVQSETILMAGWSAIFLSRRQYSPHGYSWVCSFCWSVSSIPQSDLMHSHVYELSELILQNDSTTIPIHCLARKEQPMSISGSSEAFSLLSLSEIFSDSYSIGSTSFLHDSTRTSDRYILISRRHSYSHSQWYS